MSSTNGAHQNALWRSGVSSGGIAQNVLVNLGGNVSVAAGGSASILFNPWSGTISAEDGAQVTYLENDAKIYYGNAASGLIGKSDSLEDFSVSSGTSVILLSGGTAHNTNVNWSGTLLVSSGGMADYVVMVDGSSWAGNNMTTQRIFAQNVICMYGSDWDYNPETLQGTTSDDVYRAWNLTENEGLFLDDDEGYSFFNYGDYDAEDEGHETLRTLTLHFGVDESGTATIGFRTDNLNGNTGEVKLNTIDEPGNGYGWFKIDNFTLYYESRKVPTRIETPEIVTGLQADKAVYDLSGRRVEKMSKGVYVRNGKKIVR